MSIKILDGIEAIGPALWIEKAHILIIADLHIGYEESLNKQGILVPRTQLNETIVMFKQLFSRLKGKKIKTIVVNGDLKHEFGEISRQEWHETSEILELLMKKGKIILIRGNHDTILEPIAKKKGLEIVNYHCIDDICVLHGNKILDNQDVKKAKILIIGHEHPAVSLREGAKVERYKCFLLGRWKRSETKFLASRKSRDFLGKQKLIVMPSFLPIVEGSNVKKEKLLSPYLQKDLGNFKVWILGDRVYEFGKLKRIYQA